MPAALAPNQRLIVNAEVARLLKRIATTLLSKTLTFTEAEAASYQHQIGLWAEYFTRSSEEWRPSARLHQRPCAASPADLVLRVGGVGFGRGSARDAIIPTPTIFRMIPRSATCRPAAPCYGARSA